MNQAGQQGFNYGGNYGEFIDTELCFMSSWIFEFHACNCCLVDVIVVVVVLAGMNQQGDPSFMAPGSSPPANMMQGRMGGPPQNTMMPGMQGNPQGGPMYPSGDMKGWPQGGMPRNKYVACSFLEQNYLVIKYCCIVYKCIVFI